MNEIKYTIYIPSKGRPDICLTANLLDKENIPYYLVVEEKELEQYLKYYESKKVLILPDSELQSFKNKFNKVPGFDIAFRRSWIKKHSENKGEIKHWQIDDNIKSLKQVNKGKSKVCSTSLGIKTLEEFTDRYQNVAISGFRHSFLSFCQTKPFQLNQQIYSFFLVQNNIPYYWKPETIEDTDYSLQVLSNGYCTILFNFFVFDKPAS